MKLRTEINSLKSSIKIEHQSSILLVGSCFAENIGRLLSSHKFKALSNPMGIAFNPVSLSNNLQRYSNFRGNEFIDDGDIHFNYQLHSKFNSTDKTKSLKEANQALKQQKEFLKDTDCIFITLGTAWVYELNKTREIVNNCHKQDSKKFTKRLLSVKEIKQSLVNLLLFLNRISKKDLQVVFTVSPIRHIKDGIRENQISKSVLHVAINELSQEFANCNYFPAYEIMLDDLRDYRFYKSDLIHPNETAISYIWEKFSETYLSEKTKSMNLKVQGFNSSIAHKAFNSESAQHQSFLKKLIQQLIDFQNQEKINFQEEIQQLEAQLLSQ